MENPDDKRFFPSHSRRQKINDVSDKKIKRFGIRREHLNPSLQLHPLLSPSDECLRRAHVVTLFIESHLKKRCSRGTTGQQLSSIHGRPRPINCVKLLAICDCNTDSHHSCQLLYQAPSIVATNISQKSHRDCDRTHFLPLS